MVRYFGLRDDTRSESADQAADHLLPREGDHLFVTSSDSTTLSTKPGSWAVYAEGYKRAADLLVQRGDPKDDHQLIVYAVVFLYRHYLELKLKALCGIGFILRKPASGVEKATEKLLNTHDVLELWQVFSTIAGRSNLWGNGLSQACEAPVKACIAEIAQHDQHSYAFRYPISKKLVPNLPGLANIDLQHLRRTMDRLARFLSVAMRVMEREMGDPFGDDSLSDAEIRDFTYRMQQGEPPGGIIR